ncbi:MAG TPA: carboxylating nicotinate-nucleotide diphosphorylase [Longimicrobiales bacterium]|nr:carboxylating nicotinate-nucleotide diphosphorylase [Longimicrobiales bacterium]
MTGPDAADLARARAALVRLALEEDVGEGDWTTQWTVPPGHACEAVVVAKQAMVVAGGPCVRDVFRAVDPALSVELAVRDGSAVEAGRVLVRLSGSTRSVLVGERTALNFLGRLSGIATLARRFVDAVAGTGARIVDTRKTTPGWRLLEKAAVRAGGATNHRMGLYDMLLVKDNHADASGGVVEAVRAARAHNERGLLLEVEVRDLAELQAVLPLGVDRVLLDNMTLEGLREAVRLARAGGPGGPRLEASGNVSLDTVRAIAETGIDFVSVGALTHSAPVADVSLKVVARP